MKFLLFRRGIAVWGLLALLTGATGCRPVDTDATFDTVAARQEIRTLLNEQVAAWNRGDIEGFMAGYARVDSLRYASGGSVYRGWHAALDRYRRAYPDRAAMGTLTFDRLDLRVLSPRWAMVFGAWRLERSKDAPHGLFTLLLERREDGWRIVHDHTSSAQ